MHCKISAVQRTFRARLVRDRSFPIYSFQLSQFLFTHCKALMQSDSGDGDFQSTSKYGSTLRNEHNEHNAIHNALHLAVGNICREEERAERENSINTTGTATPRMSREAIETLTQMTYHYATKCLAKDLVSFRKHAGRKTISVDDVKLVARKNPRGLMDSLEGFCEQQQENSNTTSRREKKIHNYTKKLTNFKTSKKRSNKDISGGTSIRLYEDSSSDDGLAPVSNFGKRSGKDTRRSNSSSDTDLGIDLQVDDSSSSSSSSSDSSDSDGILQLKLKRNRSQVQKPIATKGNTISNLDDSSDDDLNFATKPNEKMTKIKKIQSAIELSDDSDSD